MALDDLEGIQALGEHEAGGDRPHAPGLLDPGDEVIIPTPCFVSYQAEVIMANGVPVEVTAREENNFMVDPADIRKAITPNIDLGLKYRFFNVQRLRYADVIPGDQLDTDVDIRARWRSHR